MHESFPAHLTHQMEMVKVVASGSSTTEVVHGRAGLTRQGAGASEGESLS